MYTHFTANTQSAEHKKIFENLSVDILTDIGDLYIAWESLDRKEKPLSNGKKLSMRLVLTCNQLFRVITLANAWTPFVRTAKISGFLERKWLRILADLKVDAGKELAVLNDLSRRAEIRARTVKLALEKVVTKDYQTQAAFDTAEITLLDKSFGF
jgi:hypothetical protein